MHRRKTKTVPAINLSAPEKVEPVLTSLRTKPTLQIDVGLRDGDVGADGDEGDCVDRRSGRRRGPHVLLVRSSTSRCRG